MSDPGPRLLASGRDSDIFEHGPGLVLRRARTGRSMETEAKVMDHARAHGYPVPAVEELRDSGRELVMERVEGPTLLRAMERNPWKLRRHAQVLSGLHHRLHDIPAPSWLRQSPDGGDRLIHLDLHPLNVLMTRSGPVVIDWPNAARGEAETDIALTWLILGAADIPKGGAMLALLERFRGAFLSAFLAGFDRAAVADRLTPVAEWRGSEQNTTDSERAAMARLIERELRR